MSSLEDQVREEVGKVQDPETGQTFSEMQMIQSVKETGARRVHCRVCSNQPILPNRFQACCRHKSRSEIGSRCQESTGLLPWTRHGAANQRNDQQTIDIFLVFLWFNYFLAWTYFILLNAHVPIAIIMPSKRATTPRSIHKG